MNFYGELLPEVPLRFNRTSQFATATSTRSGLQKYGPYDVDIFPDSQIHCGLIYLNSLSSAVEGLVDGLTKGSGNVFPGFSRWFRTSLIFDSEKSRSITDLDRSLRRACNDLSNINCSIAILLLPKEDIDAYRIAKTIFLSNGIPCQVVTAQKFQDQRNRPWILGNLALALYAKAGGTPWVVAGTHRKRELVLGVSRAKDSLDRYVVGFVTLFNQDGDFLFLHSKTPVMEWERYIEGLEDMIIDAYEEYESMEGIPEALVIHFHKKTGFRELHAVESALNKIGNHIPYALVHLNEFSAFRLFDTSHISCIPKAGFQVSLSRHRSLLLLDGITNNQRRRMGVPNVWDITMDKRSTLSADNFPHIVRQINRFSKVNWRGLNAKAVPVTINYSKLICGQVMEVGLDSWNTVISNGRLREKAWFL